MGDVLNLDYRFILLFVQCFILGYISTRTIKYCRKHIPSKTEALCFVERIVFRSAIDVKSGLVRIGREIYQSNI